MIDGKVGEGTGERREERHILIRGRPCHPITWDAFLKHRAPPPSLSDTISRVSTCIAILTAY